MYWKAHSVLYYDITIPYGIYYYNKKELTLDGKNDGDKIVNLNKLIDNKKKFTLNELLEIQKRIKDEDNDYMSSDVNHEVNKMIIENIKQNVDIMNEKKNKLEKINNMILNFNNFNFLFFLIFYINFFYHFLD